MNNINLKTISVKYGDGNGNTIAVCCKEHSRDSIKYKLYKTNNELNNFELISTSDSPTDFDLILYSNDVNASAQKLNKLDFISINDNKQTEFNDLTVNKANSKSNKKCQNSLKRKPLF